MSGSTGAGSQPEARPAAPQSNAYELFILVLTLLSLAIMVGLLLPLTEETTNLLMIYDNAVCLIFLADFAKNLLGPHGGREYFIRQRGWLDLLGSIPSLGILRYAGTPQARADQQAHPDRAPPAGGRAATPRGRPRPQPRPVRGVHHRAVGVPRDRRRERPRAPVREPAEGANIATGGDAFWWGIVTITTVGYGDRFPITLAGRITGAFVMFAGVGIIGSLASILASVLVPTAAESAEAAEAAGGGAGAAADPAIHAELVAIRTELAELRRSLDVADTA